MMIDRSEEREERNIVLAPLNRADTGPLQPALKYRLFLASCRAPGADACCALGFPATRSLEWASPCHEKAAS
jgi:hypothetical protein